MTQTTAETRLELLAGEWEISVGGQDFGLGRTTFSWSDDGKFLHQHAEGDLPEDAPAEWRENSPMPVTTIMGVDDSTGRMVQLYADARGVFRIYEMSIEDGVWKVWREAPGFNQRFVGRISEDGRTITGAWEGSEDGVTWRHDFDLTYTKVS